MDRVTLTRTVAAGLALALVIALATLAVVNLVNATTALAERLQFVGTPHHQRHGAAVAPTHDDRNTRSSMKRTITRIGIGAIPAELRTGAVEAYAALLARGYAPPEIFYAVTRTGSYRVTTTDGYSIPLRGTGMSLVQ